MRDVNSLNKVILIGRLGQKPELRYLPKTEKAVANFSLATNERTFNPSTNESDVRVEWHRIVVWDKLAEFCEKYLTQGKQIMVEGRLRTRKWQDRDGNNRYTTEITAFNIVLLGKKEDTGPQNDYADSSAISDFPQKNKESADNLDPDDDDVPF